MLTSVVGLNLTCFLLFPCDIVLFILGGSLDHYLNRLFIAYLSMPKIEGRVQVLIGILTILSSKIPFQCPLTIFLVQEVVNLNSTFLQTQERLSYTSLLSSRVVSNKIAKLLSLRASQPPLDYLKEFANNVAVLVLAEHMSVGDLFTYLISYYHRKKKLLKAISIVSRIY